MDIAGIAEGFRRQRGGLERLRAALSGRSPLAAGVALVASLWLGLPTWAQAQNPAMSTAAMAAELRSVSGVVFTQRPGGEIKIAQANATLAVGDTVGTQKGAFALVVFNDGSRVALRPESALAIRGFSYKPDDPSADQMSVQLLKGWLRNVSGQIGKRGNASAFEMKVNDATIGIRGTDFAVRLCDEECATNAAPVNSEGVLPQSGRLGQLLTSNQPVQRRREGGADADTDFVSAGAALFLGDTVTAGDSDAVLALDDGTRMVLAPGAAVVLRAEEDARGRRAVRLDLQGGTIRVATPEAKGARLYGLLLNAGETVGLRQDTAVDLSCDSPASGGFSCPSGSVLLRRGQAEVLSITGLRSLRVGAPARVAEPRSSGLSAPTSATSPSSLQSSLEGDVWQSPGLPWPPGGGGEPQAAFQEWDTWAPGSHPLGGLLRQTAWQGDIPAAPFDTAAILWAQAAPPSPGSPVVPPAAPAVKGMFDPTDIPVDAARPPGLNDVPARGVYTVVFQGQIQLSNPSGQVLVSAGQGAFSSFVERVAPKQLPVAPKFMELDKELDKSRIYPQSCVK